MAQIRNRFDIKNTELNENTSLYKNLPNFFNDVSDEISPVAGSLLSIASHFLFVLLCVLLSAILPHMPQAEPLRQDVEFKLVQNESKPPINKNTKIRSDRDSQAGGKHDPKKPISEPMPQKSAPKKQAVAQKEQVKTTQQKQVAKQPVAPKAPTKQVVAQKPTPVKAPTAVKPNVSAVKKPSGVSTPTAPKITSAPKSPFTVSAPTSKAPVGSTYKPAGAPSSSSGASGGNVAPAPKFSSSGGSSASSTGSSGSKYASKGSYGGSGSQGNPGPGNPNGAPGIDALRQPNWGAYMSDLEKRISRNWHPPVGESSKRVVIAFKIGRDGRLLSHSIIDPSGSPLEDRAALSAIELTAPFAPLPPEFKGQSVNIDFTFDHNILNSTLKKN